jgi:hypothetical protein
LAAIAVPCLLSLNLLEHGAARKSVQDDPELHTENSRTTMSVGDSITCECNNCVDEEIKTVSARHAEAFAALVENLVVLSSKVS